MAIFLKNSKPSPGYYIRNYHATMFTANKQKPVTLKSVEDMPGPKPLPVLGNVLDYVKNEKKQHLWFKELQTTYGDIIKINLGLSVGNMVYIFNPEYSKIMLTADGPYPDNFVFDHFLWYRNVRRKELYPDGFSGLVGSYPEFWRQQRTAVNPVLMRKKSALYYLEDLEEISSQCIDRIAEQIGDDNEITDAIPAFIKLWSLEASAKVFLDTRIGCLEREMDPKCAEWVDNVRKMFLGSSKMLRNLPLWKYMDVDYYKEFDEASSYVYNQSAFQINEAIKRMQENQDYKDKPRDKWSMIAKLTDRFGENSSIPIVIALDALLGGVDSTSSAVSFLLYNLARNPLKQEMLIEEIDRVCGDGKITMEKFVQLPYLKACMTESARLTPAANGSARRLSQDIVIEDYLIPKGTCVVQLGYVNANDPRNFNDPERFWPERWLRGHPDHHNAHPYSHLPFGFGSRMCIGKRFAETKVQVLVVKMLQRFRMEYHLNPIGMNFTFVNNPDSDIRLRLYKRL